MVEAEEIVLEPENLVLNVNGNLIQFVKQRLILMVVSQDQKLVEGQKINIKLFGYGFGIPFLVKSTIPKGVAVAVSEKTSLQILGEPQSYKRLENEMLIPEALNALIVMVNALRDYEKVLDRIVRRFEKIVTHLDKIVGRIEALEKKEK